MRREAGQGSFADVLVVGGGNRRLERIAELLDWGRLEGLLGGVYASGTGRPSYAPLTLLRILLLQGWYGLSDPAMEEALGDRLSFRRFAGLGLDERAPDHSTISRFRTLLADRGLADGIFAEVGRQLDAQGVTIRSGTLIDATVIEAAAAEPHRQKGGGRSQADPDARWVKSANGQARFGYKLHAAVDLGTGIVRRAIVTGANVADVDQGHHLVCGDETAVYADKGYVGPRLRERLARDGIRNRVQKKAGTGRPLTPRETWRNRLIGYRRGRIEAVFGTLKRSYGLARMRLMGLARNTCATLLTLTAWNLARAAAR
ncbi:IS5 family transposase [Sphingomonas naphthae]|uniref:IS5 family transposase n=1 Tax=Sphingomonas naphthae TaxID=1813468 RepID=A0ABY7TGC5_9SPHN|nr:IS5 family transposase [Sphingomonas naphthae]WCT71985.1 IS5 family transposase [Sphingomonas naphthae]WCT74770.1 IS5 family transposase [Sphingomonas naphthae]